MILIAKYNRIYLLKMLGSHKQFTQKVHLKSSFQIFRQSSDETLLHFVLDKSHSLQNATPEGIDKPTIRETKFLFKQDQQYPHQQCFSACFGFNSYSVFHTKREHFEDESPVFYVDNETEEVVFTETWKSPECITYFNNFFPCWNGSSFTRAEYDDKKFEEVTLESKEIMDLSNQYLQFLLHLNEDFDDDLLQDAISLLIDL